MTQSFKYKLILILLFSAFSVLIEVLTFGMLDFGALPVYFWLDIGILFMIDAALLLIPNNMASLITASAILLVQCVISYINTTMYDVYGDLFSLQFITLTHEAIEAIGPNMLNLGKGFIILMAWIFFVLLGIGILIRYINNKKYSFKSWSIKFLSTAIALVLTGNVIMIAQKSTFQSNDTYYYTQDMKYRYSELNIKSESFKNFGTLGYYFKEFKNIYLTSKKIDQITMQDIANRIKANSEKYVTDYTGLLENKNVITIMLESVQNYVINEELTPNLYRLTTQGINFSNNYSRNKTNVSEFIGITGAYPATQQIMSDQSYYLPYSVANILKDEGYITTYIHENEGSYYSRDSVMPKIGFDHTYFYEDFYSMDDYEWGMWDSDSQFVEKAIDKIVPSATEKFYTFYTTLTTHGPYADKKAEHMIELFEEMGYHNQIDNCTSWINPLAGTEFESNYRQYQSAVMDLDKAIGMIIAKCEEYGILDDTVFVVYGDHQVYYDQIYMLVNGNELNDFSHSNLYKTPLFIYNPGLTDTYKLNNSGSNEFAKFTSTYNIVPTLLDLLGADYYPALYIGTSAFYDEEDYRRKNVFVSLQGGIFNDKIFTLNGVDLESSMVTDYEEYLDELQEASNYVFSKFDYIEKVINNDVFNYVDYETLTIKD